MARETHTRKEWKVRPELPSGTMDGAHLPAIVSQVLYHRGITTKAEIDEFFRPSRKLLHDPTLLPNVDAALHRLYKAYKQGESIAIFGDFDVDGITGTAIMAQGLSDLGAKVIPYIPHRIAEGHGLNGIAVQGLSDQGATVLVTVDCGVGSHDEIAQAQDLGMDVIVTDHHVPPPELPPALAVVDPKLDSSTYPFPYLSGGGLAFKLIQGLYDMLDQPWNTDLLELAALSTVADLVPLKDENRYLVIEGLKALRCTSRPGLLALYDIGGISSGSISTETISFGIAPRLNAAGRLGHAITSYKLLLTTSHQEARTLAERLDVINRERQQLTQEARGLAIEQVMSWPETPPILLVIDERFSPGIAGLVASKLVDEFHRPAVVMSHTDGMIRASARSIPEFDVGDALFQCSDLFTRHGGHPQAAGFEMLPENLDVLKERLLVVAEGSLKSADIQPSICIDAEVSVMDLTGETFRLLVDMEPYGAGNPRPVFLSRGVNLLEARHVGRGGQHLRLKLKEGRVVFDAIAFGWGDQKVPDTNSVDLVYTIDTEERGGVEVMSLKVLDLRPSDAARR